MPQSLREQAEMYAKWEARRMSMQRAARLEHALLSAAWLGLTTMVDAMKPNLQAAYADVARLRSA